MWIYDDSGYLVYINDKSIYNSYKKEVKTNGKN